MRITTQMLDETARKTGIIMNRHNLLDYVNSGSRANPLLNTLPPKSNYTANVADKTRYEKQEKAADGLYEQTQKFMVEEDKDKLKEASLENVEKVLGKDNSFIEKLGYLSSRIADNANAYLESASNSYLPNGNIANNYSNKYDFWG